MLDQLKQLRERLPDRSADGSRSDSGSGRVDLLQLLAAHLLLVTGIGTALDGRRTASEDGDHDVAGRVPLALTWTPAVLGPVAGIAHAAYAFSPTSRNRAATRVLDLAVIGGGLLALGCALAEAREHGSPPALSALSLTSAGGLGMLLERGAAERAAERWRLERRASVVERLVPRRRARLDRIVLHA